MKICAYVQGRYAKKNYKQECFNVRQWVGLSVCIDAIRRAGYTVEYAGMDTVHEYDVVLVSMTSDCDWWPYVAERQRWSRGRYLTIIGGPGVLNIRPWLTEGDVFVFGRGEAVLPRLLDEWAAGRRIDHSSVAWADMFSPEKDYYIAQATEMYPHDVPAADGKVFLERSIGCPHKCLFCSYTWSRKYIGSGTFKYDGGLFTSTTVRERAILDMHKAGYAVDYATLRITAIDGMSERLRRMVNKRITRAHVRDFLCAMAAHDPPHQIKIYNILGYPTETEDDWREFLADLQSVDQHYPAGGKQWSIVLHSTPLRPMPATPIAHWPVAYREHRGAVARALGRGRYKGNIFYRGSRFWAVEGMGCDSLSTVWLSMLAHRGVEADAPGMHALACSPQFWRSDARTRLATLERYFDRERIFSAQSPDELPTRYLKTYANYRLMPIRNGAKT